jgi:hypothetical protein
MPASPRGRDPEVLNERERGRRAAAIRLQIRQPFGARTLIPSQTVALGRFSFGPEIAYRIKTGANTFIEPQLTLLGLYNFDREKNIILDGIVASPDTVTGRVEGGVVFGFQDGITFRAAGAYEGVGSGDFSAWTFHVWGSVPLGAPQSKGTDCLPPTRFVAALS